MSATRDLAELAARWRCSEMTIRRMISRGVDPTEPAGVAIYLATVKNPAESTLEAVLEELETLDSP